MAEHGFDLASRHATQQPAADRNESSVAPCARRKGVHLGRIEYADFRHADIGLLGQARDRADEPLLGLGPGLHDDHDTHRSLGDPLREQQGDEGAAEAEDRSHHQQAPESALAQANVKNLLDDHHDKAQQRKDCEVRQKEQEDSFHRRQWSGW